MSTLLDGMEIEAAQKQALAPLQILLEIKDQSNRVEAVGSSTKMVIPFGPNSCGRRIANFQFCEMKEMSDDAPTWVTFTQSTLGSVVKKPKLSANILAKPPFRFLHDVVMEVMRLTGFAQGLFDESECDSSSFKVRYSLKPSRSV